eukprot:GHVR01087093.1.p1 GENE.GHVR01087093.1~~GHVR01087093.1.p1  ORF type:complete len:229 (+),score=88.28 GHVR01087093.1:82-768(+)
MYKGYFVVRRTDSAKGNSHLKDNKGNSYVGLLAKKTRSKDPPLRVCKSLPQSRCTSPIKKDIEQQQQDKQQKQDDDISPSTSIAPTDTNSHIHSHIHSHTNSHIPTNTPTGCVPLRQPCVVSSVVSNGVVSNVMYPQQPRQPCVVSSLCCRRGGGDERRWRAPGEASLSRDRDRILRHSAQASWTVLKGEGTHTHTHTNTHTNTHRHTHKHTFTPGQRFWRSGGKRRI